MPKQIEEKLYKNQLTHSSAFSFKFFNRQYKFENNCNSKQDISVTLYFQRKLNVFNWEIAFLNLKL